MTVEARVQMECHRDSWSDAQSIKPSTTIDHMKVVEDCGESTGFEAANAIYSMIEWNRMNHWSKDYSYDTEVVKPVYKKLNFVVNYNVLSKLNALHLLRKYFGKKILSVVRVTTVFFSCPSIICRRTRRAGSQRVSHICALRTVIHHTYFWPWRERPGAALPSLLPIQGWIIRRTARRLG